MRAPELLLALLAVLCAGCQAPSDRTERIDWHYLWDTDDPVAKISEKYAKGGMPQHGAVRFPPAVGRDGTIYLLRPHEYSEPKGFSLVATGPVQQWEVRPEGGICNIPVVTDDGTVIFGTRKDVSWAVSPEGKKKWTYSFPPASLHPPIEHSAAYPKASGSPSCSQPAVATDGTSYWIGHGVYALSSGGVPRWTLESQEDFISLCVGADGTVYALANGSLIAITPEGRERWKFAVDTYKYFAGDVTLGNDGSIYVSTILDRQSAVTILTPDGKLKRRYQLDDPRTALVIGETLIGPDGTIYITKNKNNRTYATAITSDGREKWIGPEESEVLSIASDGTLFIIDVGQLDAIGGRGNILWKAQLPEDPNEVEAHAPTRALTLSPDGKFYIGDFFGRLGILDNSVGLATVGWPRQFHDARNTSRAGAF